MALLWDVYWGQSGWSVTGELTQGRGGEETPILSFSQFLVCNWLDICQSPWRPAYRVPPHARGREAGRMEEDRRSGELSRRAVQAEERSLQGHPGETETYCCENKHGMNPL